jgi:hypothetical protein
MTLACAVGLVVIAVRTMASPLPTVVADRTAGQHLFRQGFSGVEDDGARRFRWIEAAHAVVVLPRSSASAADLVVTGQPFVPTGAAPQAMSAVLNGTSLGTLRRGWLADIPVPGAGVGVANRRQPARPGPSADAVTQGARAEQDPRHLAMAIQRIDVQAR